MMQRTRAVVGALAMVVMLAVSAGGEAKADNYWQCVPFARMASGIEIFGDAWTWWRQAAGKYAQGFAPKAGAVLVFKPNGMMNKGHVAVVSQVLTDRVIQVTHANWSIIGGARGQVEKDVTVIDVSAAGDWSQVKVWYDPARDLGGTVYPTYGFIYQPAQAAQSAQSALAPSAQSAARVAARNVAQTAMSQLAAVAPNPGAGPAQLLGQAASSTDRIAALIQSITGRADDR